MSALERKMAPDTWSLPDTEDEEHSPSKDDEDDDDADDDGESRIATYRAHAKYLYDTLLTTKLDAPACTLQAAIELMDGGASFENRFISGTYGNRLRQHYVVVHKATTPNRTVPHASWQRINTTTGELGGSGAGPSMSLDVEYRLYHDGPVEALRVWDCNPSFFVTRGPRTTDVLVFNAIKQHWAKKKPPPPNHDALLISDDATAPYLKAQKAAALQDKLRVEEWEEHTGECAPDLRLKGLTVQGDGLDIAAGKEGYVAASSTGGGFLVWKLSDAEKGDSSLAPTSSTLTAPPSAPDADTVLRFHPAESELLLGGSGDGTMFMCDVRQLGSVHNWTPQGMAGSSVHSIDWNPHASSLCAVGTSDGRVRVLDMRNAAEPLYTLHGHDKYVYTVGWCPHQSSVLASGCDDGTVCLWDLRGRDEGCHSVVDARKCPRELFFKHDGHGSDIGALAWCRNEELRGLLASVDMAEVGAQLQVWRPRNSFWVDTAP